jgi:hypothetical protein
MRRRIGGPQVLVGILFVIACILGALSQGSRDVSFLPRARFDDATPLGGKGCACCWRDWGIKWRALTSLCARCQERARVVPARSQTRFSRREARLLLNWVRAGGT